MKEPGPIDLAVGHPAVIATGSLFTVGALIAACNDSAWWPEFTLLFLAMIPICRAGEARQTYLPWKRQWDNMEGAQEPRRTSLDPQARRKAGIVLLALLVLFFAANASDPVYAVALVWLVLAVGIAAVVAGIAKRLKRQPAPGKGNQPVTIRISKPLLPVPRMRDAYRALPPHCQALFAAQEQARRATSG